MPNIHPGLAALIESLEESRDWWKQQAAMALEKSQRYKAEFLENDIRHQVFCSLLDQVSFLQSTILPRTVEEVQREIAEYSRGTVADAEEEMLGYGGRTALKEVLQWVLSEGEEKPHESA